MADMKTIGEFLMSEKWTPEEKWVIKWQFRLLGDFHRALFDAIKLADEHNLARLAEGFPSQVAGFMAWHAGNLGKRLREAGLDI